MKKALVALAIGLATSVGFAGFEAAEAKTLRMAYDADPISLDPHEQLSGATLQMSHMMFDPLIRWTQDLQFEGRIAESWEQVDGKTYRFNLRKGVKFHSGNMLTAKDVAYTLDRLKTSPDFKGLFTDYNPVKVIDDYTIEISTNAENPIFLNIMTYIFPMDSKFYAGKDEIVKSGDTFASTNVSGTGPFKLRSWEKGIRLEYERFPGYWDKNSKGNVSEAILTPIKEAPTRVAALLAGDTDFIMPVPPTDLDRVRKNGDTELVTMSGGRIIHMQMNQNRVEAFKDARVRRAINLAVNNAGIVKKLMKGFAVPAGQMSPPGYVGHAPELKAEYNLAEAKKLMKEAGYENGFGITMMAPNNRYVNDAKIATAVASMLSKINLRVDLTTMPKAQYWPKFDERAADIMMIGWHSDTEDTANFHEYMTMTPNKDTGKGQYNAGNFSNAKMDGLLIKAASETDRAARSELLKEVERIATNEAAVIYLHWQQHAWGARKGVDIAPIVNPMNQPYIGDLVMQ